MLGSLISGAIGVISGLKDRSDQKKNNAANAKATAQANYDNAMQVANQNRLNKKAVDNANIRNEKATTRTNQRNRELIAKTNAQNAKNVRETNASNAKMQLDADNRTAASSAAARAHDIEAARLNRFQGLDDNKWSAVRLREAAQLGGFNPLTYLEMTGGLPTVAGSGVGGRATSFSASSSIAAMAIAPQISAGPASEAYIRGVGTAAASAAYAAPLASTAGIAGGLQDMVNAPAQAAQAARDKATQDLKDNVLRIEAERLKTGIAKVPNGPSRVIAPAKVAANGKFETPEKVNLYVDVYDPTTKRTIRIPNPDLMDAGPLEMATGLGTIGAADALQNGVPAGRDYLKSLGGGMTPAPTPVRKTPIARKVSPKILPGSVSQSGKAGRYKR